MIGCFIFSFSEDFDLNKNSKGSILFIRDIGLESGIVNFKLKNCNYINIKKEKTLKCEDNNKLYLSINNVLKNNMEILFSQSLKDYSKIYIQKNGIRIIPDNAYIYHRNMPLFLSSDSYLTFEDGVKSFLSEISNHTFKILKLSKQKKSRLSPSFAFSIYLPKIDGAITIIKTRLNGRSSYDARLKLILKAKFIVNKFNVNSTQYKRLDNIQIEIIKNLSKKFKHKPRKQDLEIIFDNVMQSIFKELGNKFSNKIAKYSNLETSNNKITKYIRAYSLNNFITLGASSKNFKVSSIGSIKANKYNDNIPSFTFGYSRRIYDKYNIWLNTFVSIGKVEKITFIDSKIKSPYILDDSKFLSLDMSLSKKIYLGSSRMSLSPIFGLGISRISPKKTNRFTNGTTIESYNTFIGGEFGYDIGLGHELSTYINYNIPYASFTRDSNEKSGGYKTALEKGWSISLFYKYYF